MRWLREEKGAAKGGERLVWFGVEVQKGGERHELVVS